MMNIHTKKKIYFNAQTNILLVVKVLTEQYEYEGINFLEYRPISPERLGYELVGEL